MVGLAHRKDHVARCDHRKLPRPSDSDAPLVPARRLGVETSLGSKERRRNDCRDGTRRSALGQVLQARSFDLHLDFELPSGPAMCEPH
jgi:hypothetical protein